MQRDGKPTVSSRELGAGLGLTDAQVRKDLGCFGQFGQPGVGYQVVDLIERIPRILGADKTRNVLLVGAGRLGTALARYKGFAGKRLRLVGVLDDDPQQIGRDLGPECDLWVRSMDDLESLVAEHRVRLAIICVPAASAQRVADRLVATGIKGLLNFAPVSLSAPGDVALSGVDLAVQLEQLSFQVGLRDTGAEAD